MKFKFNFKTDFPALVAGDKAAFNNLMQDFYGWSINQAKETIRYDTERAHDVALSFWEQLPKTVQTFDGNKGAFLTWAAACIRNLAVNELENQRPKLYSSDLIQSSPVEDDPTLRMDALQDFDAIVECLQPQEQDVFWRLIEGVSVEELAEELGVSEKRTRNLVAQVRRVIRGQMEDE
jgi:RNA polymerase sigma factor (sigma-70 family)